MSMPSLDLETRERLAQLARSGQTDELIAALGDASPDVPDVIDGKGDSLLMLAAYHGHKRTVAVLLARGASPSLRNLRGLSPLDGAAFKGELEVIDALLDAGASANEQGPDGRTPLMWAAAFNRLAAVERLLARGANPHRVDRAGLSAAAHAHMMGAVAVVPVLARAA